MSKLLFLTLVASVLPCFYAAYIPGYYFIQKQALDNGITNRVISGPSAVRQLTLDDFTGRYGQLYNFTNSVSANGVQGVNIRDQNPANAVNYLFDSSNQNYAPGTQVLAYDENGGPNQNWVLDVVPTPTGQQQLTRVRPYNAPNMCVDSRTPTDPATYKTSAVGSVLILSPCDGTTSQQFALVYNLPPVAPTTAAPTTAAPTTAAPTTAAPTTAAPTTAAPTTAAPTTAAPTTAAPTTAAPTTAAPTTAAPTTAAPTTAAPTTAAPTTAAPTTAAPTTAAPTTAAPTTAAPTTAAPTTAAPTTAAPTTAAPTTAAPTTAAPTTAAPTTAAPTTAAPTTAAPTTAAPTTAAPTTAAPTTAAPTTAAPTTAAPTTAAPTTAAPTTAAPTTAAPTTAAPTTAAPTTAAPTTAAPTTAAPTTAAPTTAAPTTAAPTTAAPTTAAPTTAAPTTAAPTTAAPTTAAPTTAAPTTAAPTTVAPTSAPTPGFYILNKAAYDRNFYEVIAATNRKLGHLAPPSKAEEKIYTNTTQRGGYLTVHNVAGTNCLDIFYNRIRAGSNVGVYPCNRQPNQKWVIDAPNGSIWTQWHPYGYPNLCMDTIGQKSVQGTGITIARCNGSTSQLWYRSLVDKTPF